MASGSLSFPDWIEELMKSLEEDGKIASRGNYFQEAGRKGLMKQLEEDFPEEYKKYSKK